MAVILFLAWLVTRSGRKMGSMKGLLGVMVSILPIVGLVGASNLSTAIIILGIGVILVFVASPRYTPFLLMGAVGAGFMAVFLALESYRLERLLIWRNPEAYEKGYQTLQGLYAIGSGGLVWPGAGRECAEAGICAGGSERYDLLHHLRGIGVVWSRDPAFPVSGADLALFS